MWLQGIFEYMYCQLTYDYNNRFQLKRKLHYLKPFIYLLIVELRIFMTDYFLTKKFNYFSYDKFSNFAFEETFENFNLFRTILWTFALFIIYLIMLNNLVYQMEKYESLDLLLDVVKFNPDDYLESNQLSRPLLLNVYKYFLWKYAEHNSSLKQFLLSKDLLENWNKLFRIKFKKKLIYFKFLSDYNRLKLITVLALQESMLTMTFFLYLPVFVSMLILLSVRSFLNQRLFDSFITIVDIYWSGWIIAWYCLRIAYIMMNCLMLFSIALILELNHLKKLIRKPNTKLMIKHYAIVAHSKVAQLFYKFNDENSSRLMYAYLVINIPVSSIYLTMIIYAKLSTMFMVFLGFLSGALKVALIVSLIPPALVNRASKSMAKSIPRMQTEIPKNNVRLQLKYMVFYEHLRTNKMGLKLGPFGITTVNIVLEVRGSFVKS